MRLEFSRQNFEKIINIKFYQNPSSRSRVVVRRRTERHHEATSRFSQFCEHAQKWIQNLVTNSEDQVQRSYYRKHGNEGRLRNVMPCICTRWFKYDRDYLCVNKSQFVPVIFEPPCICTGVSEKLDATFVRVDTDDVSRFLLNNDQPERRHIPSDSKLHSKGRVCL